MKLTTAPKSVACGAVMCTPDDCTRSTINSTSAPLAAPAVTFCVGAALTWQSRHAERAGDRQQVVRVARGLAVLVLAARQHADAVHDRLDDVLCRRIDRGLDLVGA